MSGVVLRFVAKSGRCGAWLWDLSVFEKGLTHCELKRDHDGPHRHGTETWTHRLRPAPRPPRES